MYLLDTNILSELVKKKPNPYFLENSVCRVDNVRNGDFVEQLKHYDLLPFREG